MTSGPANQSTAPARSLSEWFSQAAQIVGGISVASYAFGWVLTSRLYNGLGVDPEELGITPPWLAIRAFLVGLLGLVVMLGVRKLFGLARRGGQPAPLVLQHPVATALGLLLACLGVAGIIVFGYLQWLAPEGVDSSGAVIAIVACAALTGLLIWTLRPSFRFSRRWFLCAAGILSGSLVTGAVMVPFLLADRLLADVHAGRPVSIGLLGVHLIKVEKVRVDPADPSKPSPATECALRLGSSSGTSVFVVGGKAIRASDQNISVTSPC